MGAVTDALLAALQDNDSYVKHAAAEAMGSVARRMESAKRAECVRALIRAARQPVLEGRFSRSDKELSDACHASLRKLTAVDSAPETRVLLKNLEHLDSRERRLAIYTLPRRKLADPELAQIRRLRDDPEHRPWVRLAALETLVEIAREADAVARDKQAFKKAVEEE